MKIIEGCFWYGSSRYEFSEPLLQQIRALPEIQPDQKDWSELEEVISNFCGHPLTVTEVEHLHMSTDILEEMSKLIPAVAERLEKRQGQLFVSGNGFAMYFM